MWEHFIGSNGLVLKPLVDQAKVLKNPEVSLLLDQEKTYDRVNPKYLIHVLTAFGFHEKFIDVFITSSLGLGPININGLFSPIVIQQRRL